MRSNGAGGTRDPAGFGLGAGPEESFLDGFEQTRAVERLVHDLDAARAVVVQMFVSRVSGHGQPDDVVSLNDRAHLGVQARAVAVVELDVGEHEVDFDLSLDDDLAAFAQAGHGNHRVVLEQTSEQAPDRVVVLDGEDGLLVRHVLQAISP